MRQADVLKEEYTKMRAGYCGLPTVDDIYFDTEMVSNVIDSLKRGKASHVVGLTAEHLLYSHPVLSVILSKLFQPVGLLTSCHVPNGFKHSYTVPIPTRKPSECKGNSRQQWMYEGPLRTNVKSVKTSILVLNVIKVHCFQCQSKPVYDFLLVINCNLGPISHRFRDMASYWFKIAKFSYPSHLGPWIGVTPM